MGPRELKYDRAQVTLLANAPLDTLRHVFIEREEDFTQIVV